MYVLQEPSQYGEAFLIAIISALTTALTVVARTAYVSMRDERDFLRAEVLAALRAIVERVVATGVHRDDAIREINNKLDNLRRAITRTGGGAK